MLLELVVVNLNTMVLELIQELVFKPIPSLCIWFPSQSWTTFLVEFALICESTTTISWSDIPGTISSDVTRLGLFV